MNVQELRDQIESHELQIEAKHLERTLHVMEMEAAQIPEAWGDLIPATDWDDWGEPSYFGRGFQRTTRIDDRLEGRFVPVFENEQDLRFIRAMARYLSPSTGVSVGAMENLYNYVFGAGIGLTIQSRRKDVPEGLVETVQAFVDRFLDFNNVQGVLDKDINSKSREDGEMSLKLSWDDQNVRASLIEPEQVTQPKNEAPLNDWLLDEFDFDLPSSWSFGVHTLKRDASRVFGYHVVYDGAGDEWEYVPESRMVFIKRNVPHNVKRGLSDYYAIGRDILGDDKLTRNLGSAAATIAAIVGVRKHKPGTTKTDVTGLLNDNRSGTITKRNRDGTTRTVSKIPYDENTILDTGGYDWEHGPLGASNNPNLLLVAQHLRRSIGVRWTMPEYLISGDASNGNYSSTAIAAESWVKAREGDQRFYARYLIELIVKAIRLAHLHGWFDRWGMSISKLLSAIEVNAEPPEVSTKDFLKVVQENSQKIADGYMSRRTAAAESGLDFDAEQENMNQDGDAKPVETNMDALREMFP